ncbi:MAG: transcription termination factor Rho [Peptostreptococcaceae bacterium]|nr:transcription termination factor Rho [Peptostreptococcaceae bacterium]
MDSNFNHEQKQERAQRVDQYTKEEYQELISGDNVETAEGILEILPDGFGFLRGDNYQSTENDIYISPAQVRRFNMKTGDRVCGVIREPKNNEKFRAIIYVKSVNGMSLENVLGRKDFDRLVPVYPMERLVLENGRDNLAPRIIDMLCPIGKGQRGIIVAPPRAGKTSILKNLANSILKNNPEVELMILLVDERPEEVTDIRDSVSSDVIASTFDQDPSNHIKVTEMVLARAKGLVEMGKDVVILMDSLTRLARAYNLTISPTGRSLSGGLDPGALYGPKNFFGAARNIREGGSLTIIATALVDTGSRMDEVIFEEFKGTGNMELVLDRKLAERRIYPAIDIYKSATRKEELLLDERELELSVGLRRYFGQKQLQEVMEDMISLLKNTKTNREFTEVVTKTILKDL